MSSTIQPKKKVISVRLNWIKYFKTFLVKHKDPILWGNRLLFMDGWMYSAYDVAGPEYRPPEDERKLHEFQLIYWQRRLEMVKEKHWFLDRQKSSLIDFQSNKDVALQQIVVFEDDEGNRKKVVEDMDLGVFDGDLEWLKQDIIECKRKINSLIRKKGRVL